MKAWLTPTAPAWFAQNGIPAETARVGRSSDESNPNIGPAGLGACLFVYDTQFWKASPEPNFTATDFVINSGGASQWPLPAADFQVNQKYWNPHGNSAIWDWNYTVQRLSERPSYWKVGEHYKRRSYFRVAEHNEQ